jgi:hypothetical protein
MFRKATEMLQRKQSHWRLRRRKKFHGGTAARSHNKSQKIERHL